MSLSCLIDNGQHKSRNRLLDYLDLVRVPHDRSHGIMRILENLCMLLPKALQMREIKYTMALIAGSIGGTKRAPAQMSWHLGRQSGPAQSAWNEHPLKNGKLDGSGQAGVP